MGTGGIVDRRLLIPEACDVLSRHNNRMAIGVSRLHFPRLWVSFVARSPHSEMPTSHPPSMNRASIIPLYRTARI